MVRPADIDAPRDEAAARSGPGPATEPGFEAYGDLVREMSVLRSAWSLMVLALEWALIGLAVTLVLAVGSWWAWVVALLLVGSRQQALTVLLHDGAHKRHFERSWLNDVVTDLACGLPLGISVEKNRRLHLAHHRYLGTLKDPDFASHRDHPDFSFPMAKSKLARIFAKDLSGVRIPSRLRDMGHYWPFSRGDGWLGWLRRTPAAASGLFDTAARLRCLLFLAAAAAFAFLLVDRGGPALLGEVAVLWFVPFYRLPRLHALLMQDEAYRRSCRRTRGYGRRGLWGELISSPASPLPPT
jgi:fatty acid desaturase